MKWRSKNGTSKLVRKGKTLNMLPKQEGAVSVSFSVYL